MKKLFSLPRAFARRRFHPLTWKRRWKVLVLDLLGREESPERVAAAIAMGIAVGFSPFIGFHIWIALGLAFVFRLNKIDAALGQFAGNPWTLPAIYAFGYRLGRWILHYDRRSVPRLAWDRLLHSDVQTGVHANWLLKLLFFWKAFKGPAFAPRLLSFLVGTTVIAVAIGLATYVFFLAILRIYHRRHPRVAIRAAQRRNTDTLRVQKQLSAERASEEPPRPPT